MIRLPPSSPLFPTRRSSDLIRITAVNRGPEAATLHILPQLWFRNTWSWGKDLRRPVARKATGAPGSTCIELQRSEEHTSELQSHHDLVCRLLLEKKIENKRQ